MFYNLGAQGILNNINGILIGRPKDGKYYEEYNEVIKEVTRIYNCEQLPIISNCHFGHAWLWNILPLGINVEIDCNNKKICFLESSTNKLINNKGSIK